MNPVIIEKLMAVATYFNINYTHLFNRNRNKRIIIIRHNLYYYFIENQYSIIQLATFFQRHKSTILYAHKKITKKPQQTIYKILNEILGN
jgi:chromosomal replication initiation ATPase DnaA